MKLMNGLLALLLLVGNAFSQERKQLIPILPGAKAPVVLPKSLNPEEVDVLVQAEGRRIPPELEAQLREIGFTPEQMAKLWAISAKINQTYVDPIEKEKMLDAALEGMVKATGDPHSQYMTKKAYEAFKESNKDGFSGIGVKLEVKNGTDTTKINLVFPKSPALKAGLQAGDLILTVDGKPTSAMEADEVVQKIKGQAGTPVNLTIRRYTGEVYEDLNKTVVRGNIEVPTTHTEMVKGTKVGYIHLAGFGEDSATRFIDGVTKLKKDGMTSLIVDLRGNPGGYLHLVAKISAVFLKQGTVIVTTRSRKGEIEKFEAPFNGPLTDLPLAVLIDDGSASASEIFAGAMQDLKRAKIIGKKSYGKGTVQTVDKLPDGSALKLTIARYYLPSGRSIDKKVGSAGITPDIEVKLDEETEKANAQRMYKKLMGEKADGDDAVIQAAVKALTGK